MFKATTLHFITDANPTQLRALLYLYVEHHPECLEDFVMEVTQDGSLKKPFTAGGQTYRLTQAQYDLIKAHCRQGNKVSGIKEHRNITQAGLKESKDWVEEEFYHRDAGGNWVLKS